MKRGTSGISCLLAVDKPLGLSSHDVVNRVRRALGERRVGHAGTLDPAATGVLVVGVGTAARLLGQLTLDDKRYVARIAFGDETTTDDAEGEIVRQASVPPLLADASFATEALADMVGPCEQVPPAYSAISVDGERAYARARAGQEVELAARQVTIHEASLISIEQGEHLTWTCSFHVSKGTYIRSIARDLGRLLGTAAHLEALARTSSGPIGLADCMTLDELNALGAQHVLERAIDPVRALGIPWHTLSEDELRDVQVGRRLQVVSVRDENGERLALQGERICLVHDGHLMGIWERRGGQLACSTNFPDGVAGVRGRSQA